MEHPENDDQYKGLKVNKGIADVPTVNPYIKKACPTQGIYAFRIRGRYLKREYHDTQSSGYLGGKLQA